MLEIKNISKKYVTGDLVQIALDDVSLKFRDNEFVAILGPSGSGKTTLLNIVGGLDRYDSGDLIINDISTKRYSDRDWDSYRNHTIGFVFQSYNLIPHQNILSNVELALTISGVSAFERKNRALQALDEVGLKDQAHKRPNQLSGGQMQRVAIARALVNNPDILLADEPTGALDTKTSVQIMDLLKEVAKDRLVVMVTHNPELAHEYATRIVELKDGKIISDSDSVEDKEDNNMVPVHKNMGRSSMSFLTSLLLSFNNLRTKKGRTLLTSFAGSIGIIGIALIMSLSNGVNVYIKSIQENALSEYPLTITKAGIDISSFTEQGKNMTEFLGSDGEVKENQTIESLFAGTKSNDLKSLKKYLDSENSHIYDYANTIEYLYNVTPNIYRMIGDDDYRKVNPDTMFKFKNNDSSSLMAMMNMFTTISSFTRLPSDNKLYSKQYEIKAGHWPEKYNECVVVLSQYGTVTDTTLYTLGLKDVTVLERLLEKYQKQDDFEYNEKPGTYKYNDFLGIEFKLVDVSDCYEYDKKYDIYVDKSDNKERMLEYVKKGDTLKIVGVVQPMDDSSASMLPSGIAYTHDLEKHVIEKAKNSKLVKKQLKNKDKNIFTGKEFGDESESMNLNKLFSLDEKALEKGLDLENLDLGDALMGTDLSSLNGIDFSEMDFSGLDIDPSVLSDMGDIDLGKLFQNISVDISSEELINLFNTITESFFEKASKDPSTDVSKLFDSIGQFIMTDEAAQIIEKHLSDMLAEAKDALPSYETVYNLVNYIFSGFPDYIADAQIESADDVIPLFEAYLSSEQVSSQINGFTDELKKRIDEIDISSEDVADLAADLFEAYESYAEKNKLPQMKKIAESFSYFLGSEEGQKILFDGIGKVVDLDQLSSQIGEAISGLMTGSQVSFGDIMNEVMGSVMTGIADSLGSVMSSAMGSMSSLENLFAFSPDMLKNMINVGMDSKSLQELMNSMSLFSVSSYEDNLQKLNYATEDDPSSIYIYPKDFENKGFIIDKLNEYNALMKKKGDDNKVIVFSDTVATLMSSVTDIVNIVSYVLIAFVAISLIVSSIMIGIITYISVLERTKEIGILRAIGASKRNISQVFNAETFIIGFLSGVIGIGLSLLILIPANAIIHAFASPNVSAVLPVTGGIVLIILSVILTLIGGLIPSKKAAKRDPVTALRTE